ncbi:hypothetical protein QFC21_000085 [Naganishia friedmannii]|uniref:Uncharacterized protein n=1 Tax=Naganishia friedmannii TaxID=89922 RepID=A0ACC2WCA7_9TREE|nr:hypothetical protein QFC21_000085 [Naganishia friedmannii]
MSTQQQEATEDGMPTSQSPTKEDCSVHISALLDQTLDSISQTREKFLQESKRIQAYVDLVEVEERTTTTQPRTRCQIFLDLLQGFITTHPQYATPQAVLARIRGDEAAAALTIARDRGDVVTVDMLSFFQEEGIRGLNVFECFNDFVAVNWRTSG